MQNSYCALFSDWSYQEPFRFSLHRWKTGICLHPLRSLSSPAVPTALLRCSDSQTCYNGSVLYRSNSAAIGTFARDGHILPLRNIRLIRRIILTDDYKYAYVGQPNIPIRTPPASYIFKCALKYSAINVSNYLLLNIIHICSKIQQMMFREVKSPATVKADGKLQ